MNLVPIEPVIVVEARILRGDYSVLEIRRDLGERNEFKPFLIRTVMNPGLQTALDMHCGCRWVDPPDGNKEQHGNRPKKQGNDAKPSNKGSEEILPRLGLGGCKWP